jgi:CubicO group peptidase (beta-lactamase class C family)
MTPLGMNNSAAGFAGLKDTTNLAAPHSTSSGRIRTIERFEDQVNGAAGGIISNVHDMSQWMLMQLNRGKFGTNGDKQLFSEARQQEMWTIHTVLPGGGNPRYNTHFSGYGLGWGLNEMKGNLLASHTGGLPGMLTSVSLVPDLNLGIVVLTNTEPGGGAAFSVIRNTIMDSYLGLEPFDWAGRYSKALQAQSGAADSVVTAVWKTVAAAKNTKINAADYTGVYEDKWFGKAEVYLNNNQLWFRCYRSPKLNGPMQFYQANTFAIKWAYQAMNCDAFALFALDENGKAQSIRMKGISPAIDFSFDFPDLDFHRVKQ